MNVERISTQPSELLMQRLEEMQLSDRAHDPRHDRLQQVAREAAHICFELMWREGQWKA